VVVMVMQARGGKRRWKERSITICGSSTIRMTTVQHCSPSALTATLPSYRVTRTHALVGACPSIGGVRGTREIIPNTLRPSSSVVSAGRARRTYR
jgi:hypothetical protein